MQRDVYSTNKSGGAAFHNIIITYSQPSDQLRGLLLKKN
jgi:hypothetical protein